MSKMYRYQRNCPECDFSETQINSLVFTSPHLIRKIDCFGCRQPVFVKFLGVDK